MPYLSNETGAKLTKLMIAGMLCMLLLTGYVFYAQYQGRRNISEAGQAACERGKLDRDANARGWRNAQKARIAEGQFAVAATYAEIAEGLEARSRINCEIVFPKPGVLP